MSIRMPAIGHEFGSLDHEQLERLGKASVSFAIVWMNSIIRNQAVTWWL